MARAEDVQEQLCAGFGFKPVTLAGIPGLLREEERVVQVLTHPLWDTDEKRMVLALARSNEQAARSYPGFQVAFANLFDAIHRPMHVLEIS